jgi:hypothetical protein
MNATKAAASPRVARTRVRGRPSRPRPRRPKRRLPAPSASPLQCLVLAVDTAECSGWAASHGQDEYLAFGEADTLDDVALRYIVRWALSCAQQRGLPLVLVLEAAWGGPAWVLLGLGAARERWMAAWRAAGLPRSQVVSVQPAEWRARVLGPHWSRARREQVRPYEQSVAEGVVGRDVSGDEAPAILIARWALRAAKVARVLSPATSAKSRRTP